MYGVAILGDGTKVCRETESNDYRKVLTPDELAKHVRVFSVYRTKPSHYIEEKAAAPPPPPPKKKKAKKSDDPA